MTTKAFDTVRQPAIPDGYTANSVPNQETSTHMIFDVGVISSGDRQKGTLMVPHNYTPAMPLVAYESDTAPEAIAPNALVYIGPGAQDDVLLPHFARYHARDKASQSSAPKLVTV